MIAGRPAGGGQVLVLPVLPGPSAVVAPGSGPARRAPAVVLRTVTTIVDALEEERMVVRLADPADRRDLLEITQEGLRQLRRFRAMHDSAAVELFDVLSATERRQLVRTYVILVAVVARWTGRMPGRGCWRPGCYWLLQG